MNLKFNSVTAISYIFDSMLVVGAGLMPAAFNMSGCFFSFMMLFLVSMFTACSIYLSLTNEKIKKEDRVPLIDSNRFQEIEENDFSGKKIMTLICSAVLLSAFQKYFIDLVSVVVLDFWPNSSTTVVFFAVSLLSFICFFAVGLIENITVLSLFTMLNGLFIFSLVFTLLWLNIFLPNFVLEVPQNLNQKTDYFLSLTCFVVSLFVRARLPVLYTVLKDKSRTNTILISISSAFVGFLAYGSIGYLGYRLLGNSIGMGDLMQVFLNSNSSLNKFINSSVDTQGWDFIMLKYLTKYQRVCAIITILFGMPLTIAPIIRYFKERTTFNYAIPVMTQYKIITLLIGCSTIYIVLSDTSLYKYLKYLGPTSINFTFFFFPALDHLLHGRKKFNLTKILSMIIVISSLVYLFYGLLNFDELYKEPSNKLQDISLQTNVSN